jgi:hypothetical protein
MRTCDAAVLVLRETNNPAVMWGDNGLLDLIGARAGLKTSGRYPYLHHHVMSNLSRQPGELVAGTTLGVGNKRVRIFWLPEHVPERMKKT